MKNLVLFLLLISGSKFLSAQKLACRILEYATKTIEFDKRFSINDSTNNPVIIDTFRVFSDCNCLSGTGQGVIFTNSKEQFANPGAIELYKVNVKNKIYELYFHKFSNGATLRMKVKAKKNSIILKEVHEGAF